MDFADCILYDPLGAFSLWQAHVRWLIRLSNGQSLAQAVRDRSRRDLVGELRTCGAPPWVLGDRIERINRKRGRAPTQQTLSTVVDHLPPTERDCLGALANSDATDMMATIVLAGIHPLPTLGHAVTTLANRDAEGDYMSLFCAVLIVQSVARQLAETKAEGKPDEVRLRPWDAERFRHLARLRNTWGPSH